MQVRTQLHVAPEISVKSLEGGLIYLEPLIDGCNQLLIAVHRFRVMDCYKVCLRYQGENLEPIFQTTTYPVCRLSRRASVIFFTVLGAVSNTHHISTDFQKN